MIPDNVVVLATMNPLDRGVDEVDAAFERRFAKIAMDPDPEVLRSRMIENGLSDRLRDGLLRWFRAANGRARDNPHGAVGHAYFWDVVDEVSLRRVWDHQLRFLVERAYQLDADTRGKLAADFEDVLSGEELSRPLADDLL